MDEFDNLLVMPYRPSECHSLNHFIGILIYTHIPIIYIITNPTPIDVGDDELFQNEKFLEILLQRSNGQSSTI